MEEKCKSCGEKLEKDSKFCQNCGAPIPEAVEEVVTAEVVSNTQEAPKAAPATSKPQKNGLAIAGFIVSLCSILCCGSIAVPGIVLSIIGLVKSKSMNGAGKGMAIGGIVIGSIMLVVLIFLYIIYFAAIIAEEI